MPGRSLLRPFRPPGAVALAAGLAFLLSACSLRRMAIDSLADTLSEGGAVFASDDDPALVGAALPFALKTTEMLLAEQPGHPGLLLAAVRGFTQYAYAFVHLEAQLSEDWERQRELEGRALRLYQRARDYGLRGLETAHRGIAEELRRDPGVATARVGEESLDLAYWTALAWGGAISVGGDRPELLADLPAVQALLERVAALAPAHDRGGVQEALMLVEAAMPGGREQAVARFERAVEISGGVKAAPFVSYAEAIAVPAQDLAAFARMLERALAVDPDQVPELRLSNLLAQRKARWLQEHVEDYFLATEEEPEAAAEGRQQHGARR